ncbi:MAG: ABC transporter permease [Microcystis sp.]|jgi:ABC-type transport system involved in multi-copper enzyme maturation permease subunit|uniref:Type IV pilus biogenesis protein PilI homolog n=3 Tax=Microcystis TaxID=1125 RepID=I4IMF1_MICAE|nr:MULTISPECIES: ABC transporter permease [Microcystis]MCA2817069.1 ABC transporter permease [Microcystis sp. M085S1]MCA2856080.1 ABC transporter permease [Microcystis sp. M065S1]MCZ8054610.1 ABC transporter permease [Microcystis sp. LE19-12.2C]TRT92421.1 MAG: ABC transporter permease [Microcystis flos-aquae Ma_QC_C_20070823_S18D]TRV08868.1 MAG: ABC transporter permease [Microcystis flos-aquae Mf_QC_C_20070823_S10D]TRV26389.1 MAG: ABC transporter permease [Microcystis flos-aquae Mf_QC_C_20070
MGISILRIWAIAANSFREVIRDRILYFIGFFALLMAFAWRLLPEIAVGTDEKIFLDLGLAAIGLLGVIVAVFVGTGLINKEIDKRTILVLIPKPLSRAEFILGKHLGLSGVLAVMLGVMLVIYLLMLLGMKVSFQALPLIVSVFYLGLELILIAAVAITFGVFTSSIIATLMTFGFYLMGHISKDLIQLGIISKNANILAITKNIYLILPDLERLNFRNEAVYGLLPSADVLMGNALYSLVYTGLLLGISILIFSRRQF